MDDMRKSPGGTGYRVAFWLPIILSLIALASAVLQIVLPQTLAMFAPKPREVAPEPDATAIGRMNSDNGCQQLGEKLLCWGRAELVSSDTHTRGFVFDFHTPFAGAPVITSNIDVKSGGYAFAIYDSQTTEQTYRGSIVEVQFRPNSSPVTMSYIAIGRPRS